ncbi:acyltransferase family protein [Rhodopirellula sp. SWK7]|uniref:acyltransferase family protein n=1 Tax=Rhodopirellula sp. SWK7 TaxID=595460 RepID=UPI00034A61A7|nr:acyltransferase [Rhodopirellula sp. SWK7]
MSVPTNAPLKQHRRITELDSLRALAAINLVLFHFTHVYAVKFGFSTPLGGQWPFGAYGVMMFFILSGFVNSMSLMRRGKPRDFLAARLIRIVPLFYIAIVANLVICRAAPLNGDPISTPQFLANLTLMPRVFGYQCIDPVMWTLQVEMMFYVLLVALMRFGGLRNYFVGWGVLLFGSLTLCPTLDMLQSSYGSTTWFAVGTAVRHLLALDFVPMFAIGFLLYQIKTNAGRLGLNLAGIVVAATIFHCIDHGKHNPAATALITAVVAAAAWGSMPLLRFRPLVYISGISYAVYLCHNNLGCVLMNTFDQAGVSPVACLLIVIAFSFSVGLIVTRRIEQPITRRLQAFYQRRYATT